MEKTKTGLIILLSVLILILLPLQKCFNTSHVCTPCDEDAVIIKRDTVWAKDTSIKAEFKRPKPVDSTYIPFLTHIKDSDSLCGAYAVLLNKVKIYKDSFINDEISLYVEDSVRGILQYKAVTYKLKVPREIITTETRYVYPKLGLFGGGSVVLNGSHLEIGPALGLRYKNLYVSYSRVFPSRTDVVSVGYNLQLKKKKVKKNLFF